MNKNISESLAVIQSAVASFGFSALASSNDLVIVKNRKGVTCAEVTCAGVVQKYSGSKNLCGALVRNAIAAVIG